MYSVSCTHYTKIVLNICSIGCTHYFVSCKHLLCQLYTLFVSCKHLLCQLYTALCRLVHYSVICAHHSVNWPVHYSVSCTHYFVGLYFFLSVVRTTLSVGILLCLLYALLCRLVHYSFCCMHYFVGLYIFLSVASTILSVGIFLCLLYALLRWLVHLACEQQKFLLNNGQWGTFCEEEGTQTSDEKWWCQQSHCCMSTIYKQNYNLTNNKRLFSRDN